MTKLYDFIHNVLKQNKKEKSSFENLILHHGKLLHVFLDKNTCTACMYFNNCYTSIFTFIAHLNKFQIVVWLTDSDWIKSIEFLCMFTRYSTFNCRQNIMYLMLARVRQGNAGAVLKQLINHASFNGHS